MSLHARATELLADWPAPDDAQRRLRARYLARLGADHESVWRTGRPDHLTASAVVLDAEHRRCLLVLHGRVHRWLQPGGHCEPADADLASTALREAQEETGVADLALDPAPLLLSAHPAPCLPHGTGAHLDVQFLAVAPSGAIPVCSEESHEVAWFGVDGLPERTDDTVRELVAAALRRVGAPAGSAQASSSQGNPAAAEMPSR